jgi:hypothetical protein
VIVSAALILPRAFCKQGAQMMNRINKLQDSLELFARRYGLLVILGLMALETVLEWRRQG